ncbi:hypothetical protein TRV_06221 [Trichophyton verrucosum HKI 0517]|uniref:Uncharacterized protein n=1 Tax=Trichophyton verrucosum (strain HKI 0517) TaxID=663202 RepID=D4DGB8_TRIVH|nr:uncharacterized protein TRV_06221 [Trichophyton verrucosum HKI 0517]EFE39083.1 hypothetical protein TRV_06221 [Trichophyton verrucosum HKI 0517]
MVSKWTSEEVMAYFVLGPIFVTACLIICRLSIWLLEPILEIVLEYMGAQRAVDIIREANMKRVHHRAPQPQVQNKAKEDCSPSLVDVAHDIHVFRQRDILLRKMILDTVVMGKAKEIETIDVIGPEDWKLKLADSKQRLGNWEQYYSCLIRRQAPTSRMDMDRENINVKPHKDAAQGDADAARSHGV